MENRTVSCVMCHSKIEEHECVLMPNTCADIPISHFIYCIACADTAKAREKKRD